MAMEVEAYLRRGCVFTVTIRDADNIVVPIDAGDVVRVKIGKAGVAPILDLDSITATANGSSVTATNPTTVVLNGADLAPSAFVPGQYDIEVGIYDVSQALMLHADSGPFTLFDSQLGDIAAV